jgi:hypothetical protein
MHHCNGSTRALPQHSQQLSAQCLVPCDLSLATYSHVELTACSLDSTKCMQCSAYPACLYLNADQHPPDGPPSPHVQGPGKRTGGLLQAVHAPASPAAASLVVPAATARDVVKNILTVGRHKQKQLVRLLQKEVAQQELCLQAAQREVGPPPPPPA